MRGQRCRVCFDVAKSGPTDCGSGAAHAVDARGCRCGGRLMHMSNRPLAPVQKALTALIFTKLPAATAEGLGQGEVTVDQGGVYRNCMGSNHHAGIAQADATGFQIAAKLAVTPGH